MFCTQSFSLFLVQHIAFLPILTGDGDQPITFLLQLSYKSLFRITVRCSLSIINCRLKDWTKTDFKHYLATDGKDHIFKGAEMQFGLIVHLQEVGVSSHLPCWKSRRVQWFKNRLYKMADRLLRTFMGFFPCSRTVAITFLTCCTFIGSFSLAQWILTHCSNIWRLSASALIRRPSAGLLVWTLCRPLLLNFWTFLWTHTWPSKKYTADKGP